MQSHDEKDIVKDPNWREQHVLLRRVFLGFLLIIIVIFLVIGALLVFLNTHSGKRYVLNQIQKYTHGQVQIEGISSFFSNEQTIAEIRLKDPKGTVWFEAKKIKLQWSPWKSFQDNKFIINSLAVKDINLYALPSKQTIVNLSKDKQKSINLAYVVDIQNIQIEQLFISRDILPVNMYLTVDGKAMVRDLGKMIDTETLKAIFMTKPQIHLLSSRVISDFQFNGYVRGNITEKEKSSLSMPLHLSIILPKNLTQNANTRAEIYLDWGGANK